MESAPDTKEEMVTAMMLHEQSMMYEVVYPMMERMAIQDHLLPTLRRIADELQEKHGVVI